MLTNPIPSDRLSMPMGYWPKCKFVCKECHKEGTGPLGSKVHPGKCRQAWQKKLNQKQWQKRKAEAKTKAAAA